MSSLAALVNERIELLRPRLLDTTRRNPLINNVLTARTASFVRIVDEKPQSFIEILNSESAMALQPLPPLDDEPPDERTPAFITAFENAQGIDEKYIAELEKIDFDSDESAFEKQEKLDRELKDRIRAQLELPPRPASGQHYDLINHAKIHKINPSFTLPDPSATATDDRFDDLALQTLLLPANLQSRLGRIYSKARTYREERGLEVVYVAVGYLDWCMPDTDPERDSFRSPIALIPVVLDRTRSPQGEIYEIRQLSGIRFNPVLSHKLRHEAKLDIDEIIQCFEGEDIDIEAAFELIVSKKPKRMKWNVKRQATFGIFPFQGIDQYYDLRTSDIDFSEFPVLKELMLGRESGSEGCSFTESDTESEEAVRVVPNIVLDADSSQFLALLKVASGDNLALEGPPGSGKSQTIVNAIANALQCGKRVLFVAQKVTALDVVYARLQALGLDKFVLPMVGTKADSDAFYQALMERLETRSTGRSPGDASIRRQLVRHRDVLADYIDLLTSRVAGTQITVHELWGLCVENHDAQSKLPLAFKTLPVDLKKYAESFGVPEFKAACADLIGWADELLELSIPPGSPWASVDLLDIDIAKVNEANARGMLAEQELNHVLGAIDSQALTTLFAILDRYSLSEVLPVLRLGQHWAGTEVEYWRDIVHGRDEAYRELSQFDELYRELESICEANSSLVDEAIRLAPAAPLFRVYSEFLERLSLSSFEGPFLRAARSEIEHELAIAFDLFAKRELLDRMQVHLDPPSLYQASEARQRLFSNDWFFGFAETLSMASIQRDLKDGQIAAKKAFALLGKDQGLPAARSVTQVQRTIESAGFFARRFRPYKTAVNTACSWLRCTPREITKEALTDDLKELASASSAWEDTALADFLPQPEAEVVKSIAEVQRELSAFTGLLIGLGLSESQVSVLLTTPLVDDLAVNLRQMGHVPAAWSDIKAKRETLTDNLTWIRNNEDLLAEAEKVCVSERVWSVDEMRRLSVVCDAAKERVSKFDALVASLGVPDVDTLIEQREPLLELSRVASSGDKQIIEGLLLEPASPVGLALDEIKERAAEVESLSDRLSSGKAEQRSSNSFCEAVRYLTSHLKDSDGFNLVIQRRSIVTTSNQYGLGSILSALVGEGRLEDAQILVPGALSYYLRARAEVEHGDRMLNFSGTTLKSAREKLQQTDRKLIAMSPETVSASAIAQADPPEGIGYGRKSDYTEMALLRHELQKKRRIPPRKLLKRANSALAELFPCWMMVPSAVAQHLPRKNMFDLVIIDEASQMTPETSISALMRASQAMICGDTNQLPPTNFFKGLSSTEDEDEDVATDEESILELANTQFHPKHRLRWHYRSRHEELISFSNHYVYDDDLVIFPSPGGTGDKMGVGIVQVNGTFSRGLNPAESQVMADHIAEFMRSSPHRSLGAVVMNQSQMEHLDALVLRLAEHDSAVADYIDYWADKDDGLEKFFVKNLENVQGDERDVIFIGTVYGRDNLGKFYQRIGPINGSSGKRRLNVLFSRAKEQIVTFSSIPLDQFNPSDTNEGARLLKLWLQFSQSKRLGERVVHDDRRGVPDSPFEEHVISAVESLGFEPVAQVGVSNYYIDIGVKHSDYPFGYICGIECDGATYHSSKSARDRDRLREEVLQRLGWDLYRIWSTDWFRDPYGERERLGEYLERQLREKVAIMPEIAEPPASDSEQPVAPKAARQAQSSQGLLDLREDVLVYDEQKEIAFVESRNGPVALGSKVKVRYLDGPRAGVETKFWLTDLPEDHHAEVPGYTALRLKAPICKAIIGAYQGDLVSYDLQDSEVGVEILEVEA